MTAGMLTLHAERTERQQDRQHSEFHYDAYNRTVNLLEEPDARSVGGVRDESEPNGRSRT